MHRKIIGFHRDEEEHWVADLDCGHTQHVRHDPPWQNREWVVEPESRQQRLGTELNCKKCNMPVMPDGVMPYKKTPVFDESSIPKGLLNDHNTKAGVWGRIVVLEGELHYVIQGEAREGYVLDVDFHGVVEPQVVHYVKPQGAVRFYVEFYR